MLATFCVLLSSSRCYARYAPPCASAVSRIRSPRSARHVLMLARTSSSGVVRRRVRECPGLPRWPRSTRTWRERRTDHIPHHRVQVLRAFTSTAGGVSGSTTCETPRRHKVAETTVVFLPRSRRGGRLTRTNTLGVVDRWSYLWLALNVGDCMWSVVRDCTCQELS